MGRWVEFVLRGRGVMDYGARVIGSGYGVPTTALLSLGLGGESWGGGLGFG